MSKVTKVHRLLCLVFLVPAVSSLIISSVYAGKKKFKTVSFDTPLLPSIVKVEPNKLHLTFRQNKYMKTPNFKIEGTIPLKAPTIVRELMNPLMMNPYPEVTNVNIGDLDAIPEANQHVTYDDTIGQPVFAEPPKPLLTLGATWKPKEPMEIGRVVAQSRYPTHHIARRETEEFHNRFDMRPNTRPNFESQNFDYQPTVGRGPQHQYMQGSPSYYGNYYNPNIGDQQSGPALDSTASMQSMQSMQSMPSMPSTIYPFQYPQSQFNAGPQLYHSNSDMTASPSSYGPPKYENLFKASNHQSNKWIPIQSSPAPAIPQALHSNFNSNFNVNKKLNIGEHYNPSASYVSEKMVEKPTYDPDEAEPDEGSINFSISGPHGGEEVPVGYGEKVKAMHEELKDHPEHLPPGLSAEQLSKYYSQHTFTDALKSSYGYKPAFGPLGFLKSKLKSWKNILA